MDGRRPSDRSNAHEVEGGVAASSKTSPPDHLEDDTSRPVGGTKSGSKKAKHTRQQLELVAAVRAYYPADFLEGLPNIPALSDAVLSALSADGADSADARTVEQLGARIQYRWDHHGYASKFYAGEIESRVGAAVGMVRPLRRGDRFACADPRCENGFSLDSGVECRACVERIADRRAERRQEKAQEAADGSSGGSPAMPAPRSAAPAVRALGECANPDCRASISTASGDDLCLDCRADADETDRIRAELAAQFGTAEQREAYAANAPF
ncbi:hypothetical protein HY68_36455 [Streptomyces sp. AcH 505]|nr:hypothetical protein HY68_36455 [Streptomyces sp. AcH 505]